VRRALLRQQGSPSFRKRAGVRQASNSVEAELPPPAPLAEAYLPPPAPLPRPSAANSAIRRAACASYAEGEDPTHEA